MAARPPTLLAVTLLVFVAGGASGLAAETLAAWKFDKASIKDRLPLCGDRPQRIPRSGSFLRP